uniref:Histidine phosphatase family protein n=1 Tax=Desulfatirhabdium butyrativorans TaxID=340467 RepID=A0A7C4VQV8_9BACT
MSLDQGLLEGIFFQRDPSIEEDMPPRFGILRHARTVWNASGRIQGQQDSPLTEDGRQDAERWARLLTRWKWDRLLASDLGRALETGHRIASIIDIPVDSDARLREMDWGIWTGLTMPEIRAHFPLIWEKASSGDWSFSPPQGERYLDVHRRATAALLDAANRYPDQRILVVCHEGTLKCLYYHPQSRRPSSGPIPPMQSGCLHFFDIDSQGLYLFRPNALILSEPAPMRSDTSR